MEWTFTPMVRCRAFCRACGRELRTMSPWGIVRRHATDGRRNGPVCSNSRQEAISATVRYEPDPMGLHHIAEDAL